MVTAPLARSGAASGMVSVARLFGQTIGAMLVASCFVLIPGGMAPRACMGFGAGVALFGTGLSATRLLSRNPA